MVWPHCEITAEKKGQFHGRVTTVFVDKRI